MLGAWLRGLALILAGLVVMTLCFTGACVGIGLAGTGGPKWSFAIIAVNVIAWLAGLVAMFRGTRWIIRHGFPKRTVTAVAAAPIATEGALPFAGFGFKAFVAARYVMSRTRHISPLAVTIVLLGLYVLWLGALGEHFVPQVPRLILWIEHTFEGTLGQELAAAIAMFAAAFVVAMIMKIVGIVLVAFSVGVIAVRAYFSFFTTISIVGVWIGTFALVFVLSVMSGFETDLRDKILGSNAHIQITREDGELTGWRDVKAKVDAVPGVVASTPYAVSEVVIAANNSGMNVIIKGIDLATVGKVTKLVRDLEDKDALARLAPLIDDSHDLSVHPEHGAPTQVDPPPTDMPSGGDPIDFSHPVVDPPRDAGTAAADAVAIAAATADPPPPDLITLEDAPIDYSTPGAGRVDPTIHVVEASDETPTISRRTQALPGILVGRELEKQTHLYTGEEVRVVSPLSDPSNPDATGTPIPFNRDYRVAGIFFTGMYEYDLKYVYVTLDSFNEFLDRGDTIDGIELRVDNPNDTDAIVARITASLGPGYRVQDWKELNRSLFSALTIEKIAMFVVLGIVILVAAFSIIGNLIMVVVEKAREIALLKTLGASDVSVLQVFTIQGLMIGAFGSVLGFTYGVIACVAARDRIPLDPNVYYIDRMPIHIEWGSVGLIFLAGVAISLLATIHPALLAARVRPAAGMRH